MIDLNELTDDANSEVRFTGGVGVEDPMYCTQPSTQKAPLLNNIHEFVYESPNPPTTQNVADPGMQAMHTEEHTLDDTDSLGATGGTATREGAGEMLIMMMKHGLSQSNLHCVQVLTLC